MSRARVMSLCTLLVACGSRGILLAACGTGDIEGDADSEVPEGDAHEGDEGGDSAFDVEEETRPDVSYDIPFEDTSWWECREDGDCSDDDPCTRNTCDPETHACTSERVTGLRLDEPAIMIGEEPTFMSRPLMVWSGSEIGLTWKDGRDAGCTDSIGTTFCAFEAYFSKVAPDGTALPDEVRLSNSDNASGPQSLTWTGSEYIVAFVDVGRYIYESFITRVDVSGTEIGTEVQATGWNSAGVWKLAWTGSEITTLWHTVDESTFFLDGTRLTRLDPTLTEIGSVFISANASFGDDLAWTGSDLVVLYRDTDDQIARLDPEGTMIGTPTILDTISIRSANILWTGSEIAALWSGSTHSDEVCGSTGPCDNVFLTRVDASSGAVIGEQTNVSANENMSSLAGATWTGSEFGVSWGDWMGWGYECHLTRVAPDGTIIAEATIPRPSALVWTGSQYVLAWNEEVDGGFGIFMSRTVLCE